MKPKKLGELVRESLEESEPRARGSHGMRNAAVDDARPTTQMSPDEIRGLIGDAVPPLHDRAKSRRSAEAIAPLPKPAAPMPRSTLVSLALLALMSVVALAGWLR